MLRVGLDASAAAVFDPTGVAAAIRSLALALRDVAASEDLSVETLYRLSRLKRRSTFLEGGRLFHDRFSLLLARRLHVCHGPDARLPRLRGPKLVATIHDLSVRKDARFSTSGFRSTRERHWEDAARRADALVTYTDAVRREVARELSFPIERIAAVPLAPTKEAAPPPPDEVRACLERLGLGGGHVLVLGELSARKNTAGAVRAFRRARETSSAARSTTLLLVGRDGFGAEEVRAEVAAAGLGESIRLLGWLPSRDLAAVLASASVLLFPSRSEGFGLPLVEAFRALVPVLASRDPALVEVSGGAAIHEEADDVDAIAASLARLLEDGERRRELVARGRERVAAFSWERTARSLAQVYRSVARGAPLPAKEETAAWSR
jgi:glycosyltransferase involved in cell wall biosynthesis